jgi:hypothetical protein
MMKTENGNWICVSSADSTNLEPLVQFISASSYSLINICGYYSFVSFLFLIFPFINDFSLFLSFFLMLYFIAYSPSTLYSS